MTRGTRPQVAGATHELGNVTSATTLICSVRDTGPEALVPLKTRFPSLTCVAKKDAPKNCNDVDCTQGGLEACTCLKGRCGARIRFRENSVPNP